MLKVEVGGEDLVCDASCSHISHSSPTTVVQVTATVKKCGDKDHI